MDLIRILLRIRAEFAFQAETLELLERRIGIEYRSLCRVAVLHRGSMAEVCIVGTIDVRIGNFSSNDEPTV